jgi:hypothetical protein
LGKPMWAEVSKFARVINFGDESRSGS